MSLTKTVFVKDLKVKDSVSSIFLVKYIAVMTGKDGANYLNIVLCDNSGEIESRKWHGANETFDKIKRGDYVAIEGKVNAFQGRMQLIVTVVNKVDGATVDSSLFALKSATGSGAMFSELMGIVETLDEHYLRELLLMILNDQEIQHRLMKWSAGRSIHHSFEGGLLEHILSCTRIGKFLSTLYPVNESYVIAGCILHDICKIYELSGGPLVDYTDEGKLLGHLVQSLELVDNFAGQILNFPASMKMHLKHILGSHHGELQYGATKLPQTTEAELVYLIDLLDSKINSFETAKKNDNASGSWTGLIRHLDRIVYKNPLPSYEYTAPKEVEATGPFAKLKGLKVDE